MKKTMIALLAGIIAVFLLAPSVTVAETSCSNACTEAGAEDLEGCMKMCEEYLSTDGADESKLSCFVKAVLACDVCAADLVQTVKLLTACVEHGFESSECGNPRQMCGFDEDCISSLCCMSKENTDDCINTWKKNCDK